nr:MAG: putative 21 kDa protein [Plant associated crinivirus 1]
MAFFTPVLCNRIHQLCEHLLTSTGDTTNLSDDRVYQEIVADYNTLLVYSNGIKNRLEGYKTTNVMIYEYLDHMSNDVSNVIQTIKFRLREWISNQFKCDDPKQLVELMCQQYEKSTFTRPDHYKLVKFKVLCRVAMEYMSEIYGIKFTPRFFRHGYLCEHDSSTENIINLVNFEFK